MVLNMNFIKQLFVNQLNKKVNIQKFITDFNNNIDPKINFTLNEFTPWITPLYDFLYLEPQTFWNNDIANSVFKKLENLFNKNQKEFIKSIPDVLKHFFIAYFTYKDLVEMLKNLHQLKESDKIATRMYRLPIYINLIEGCIANLYKALLKIISKTNNKNNLETIKNLSPLINAMREYNFEELCEFVDTEIRNAISHGGILLSNQNVKFFFHKNGSKCDKTLEIYQLDKLINNTLDNVSGIFVGFLRFFINYPDIINFKKYIDPNDFVSNSLLQLQFSLPGTQCIFITIQPGDTLQLNLEFTTENTKIEELMLLSMVFAILARIKLPKLKSFFITFHNERLLPNFIKYKAEDIDLILKNENEIPIVMNNIITRQDCIISEASKEEIDLQLAKFYKFPIIQGEGWKIREIADCSLEEAKRLKASLFVGEIKTKEEIVKIVQDAIKKLKTCFNPPNSCHIIKHGNIPADSIYLSVYYKYNRDKNIDLLETNPNFILYAQYNIPGREPIKGVWNRYKQEQYENIILFWNPKLKHINVQ